VHELLSHENGDRLSATKVAEAKLTVVVPRNKSLLEALRGAFQTGASIFVPTIIPAESC